MKTVCKFCGIELEEEDLLISEISNFSTWATFRRKPSGKVARVCSKYLPIRKTRDEAEEDLKGYLRVQHVKRGKGGLCGPKVGIHEIEKMIGVDKS